MLTADNLRSEIARLKREISEVDKDDPAAFIAINAAIIIAQLHAAVRLRLDMRAASLEIIAESDKRAAEYAR